jgi:radical SAM protein with 4Fe4S-binding SPASM domain
MTERFWPSDYKEFAFSLRHKAAATKIPLSGIFELTSRCNLACNMCYIRHDAADILARAHELDASQWLNLAEQAVSSGMLFLLVTGGEVFLRRDFFDIYQPLTSMGISTVIYSNGTLVTRAIAKILGKRPPSRIEITLYGASPETYEAVTGHAEAFSQTLRGIDLLRDAGITLTIKATVTKQNFHDLDAIKELAHQRGVPVKTSWLITCRRDGGPSSAHQYRLDPETVVDLEAANKDVRSYWQSLDVSKIEYANRPIHCSAGISSFVINSSGTMNPCIDLQQPGALPLETGFTKAWDTVREFVRKIPPVSQCAECSLFSFCPSCPAYQHMETGSFTEIDAYPCLIAQQRQWVFGKLNSSHNTGS